jgi:hypothetical protein
VSCRVASRTGDHGFVDRGAAVGDAAVDRDVRAREDLEEVVPLHQIGVDLPLAHHIVPVLLRAPTTRHTARHTRHTHDSLSGNGADCALWGRGEGVCTVAAAGVVVRRMAVGACRDRSFVMASEVLPLATFSRYLQTRNSFIRSCTAATIGGLQLQPRIMCVVRVSCVYRPSMMKVMRRADVSK